MRKVFVGVIFVLLMNNFVEAQEVINLSVPIVAKPAIINYTPDLFQIKLTPPQIVVQIKATNGEIETFTYPCPLPCVMDTNAKVLTLIQALNTANLSTRSLWRRIFDRLILDFPGRFVGGAIVQ